MASSASVSRSRFPWAVENSMDGTAFSLVTATMKTKFSMLHSITLLPFVNLGISRDVHEREKPSSLHGPPNDSTDGESFTNCTHRISAKLLDVDLRLCV